MKCRTSKFREGMEQYFLIIRTLSCCLRRPPGSPPGAPSRRGFFYAASCAKTYPSLFRSSVRIGEYRELAAPIGLRQPSGGPPGALWGPPWSSMEFHGPGEKLRKCFYFLYKKTYGKATRLALKRTVQRSLNCGGDLWGTISGGTRSFLKIVGSKAEISKSGPP